MADKYQIRSKYSEYIPGQIIPEEALGVRISNFVYISASPPPIETAESSGAGCLFKEQAICSLPSKGRKVILDD